LYFIFNLINEKTMKRITVFACLILCLTSGAFAGSLQFINMTSAPVSLYIAGINITAPTTFNTSYLTLPALTTGPVYANPTLVPTMSALAQPSGRYTGVYGFCNPIDIAVGNVALGGPASTVQSVPAATACNNGNAFTVYWVEGAAPAYNLIVLIMP
jgi:hypothetical protein